jgi:hypothetical protein
VTDYTAPCDRSYRAIRSDGPRVQVKWIVLHDEEAPTALSAARYFTNPHAAGSAHLCVDDDYCFRCLNNTDVPWAAASSFGANTYGFHIEQAGYASWASALWLRHRETLHRAAYKTALHCRAFDVPPVWVPASQLPAKFGVTTHREVSAASRRLDPRNAARYSHSDPGLLWPRRLFMRYVRDEYDALEPV